MTLGRNSYYKFVRIPLRYATQSKNSLVLDQIEQQKIQELLSICCYLLGNNDVHALNYTL